MAKIWIAYVKGLLKSLKNKDLIMDYKSKSQKYKNCDTRTGLEVRKNYVSYAMGAYGLLST